MFKIRKKYSLFALFFALTFSAYSQFEFPVVGSRGAAMGGVSVGLKDFCSTIDNIAGLSYLNNRYIGIGFAENFMLSELSYKSIQMAAPISGINAMALRYTHFGNIGYSEQRVAMQYAQRLGLYVSLGVELDYLHCGTSDVYYDKYNNVSFAVALQVRPSDDWVIGAYAFNPFGRVVDTDISIASLFKLGASYAVSPLLEAAVEVEKNVYMKHNIRWGLEYKVFDFMFTRIGFSTCPILYTFGVGLVIGDLNIDFSAHVHNSLGVSPNITVNYSF